MSREDDLLNKLAQELELPEGAYEAARSRYEALGAWLHRGEARTAQLGPAIRPQGSFRLGTTIRAPEYDLDLSCRLEHGISASTHSQCDVRDLVLEDVRAYRLAHRIKDEVEIKRRCVRLRYQDRFSFHMDVVPCIPTPGSLPALVEGMIKAGYASSDEALALSEQIVRHASCITDKERHDFRIVGIAGPVSNPEGYAIWFESCMKRARILMESRAGSMKLASIDQLPVYQWKSPLQQAVMVLKNHRDTMFKDLPESKPISIIITTIAASEYRGEQGLASTLGGILSRIGQRLPTARGEVPNPVNPSENFADKWSDPSYAHLHLKLHFERWVEQAKRDFEHLLEQREAPGIVKLAAKFGVTLSLTEASSLEPPHVAPGGNRQPPQQINPASAPAPWRRG